MAVRLGVVRVKVGVPVAGRLTLVVAVPVMAIPVVMCVGVRHGWVAVVVLMGEDIRQNDTRGDQGHSGGRGP
ncbi:MAG TPA: hypothetical protein PK625_07855, partial [Spirochaetales bacterium]|nr:hypothetical protein [Spirochaetales bacterium]